MNRKKGFILLESLFSLLFLSLLIGSLIPQMTSLLQTYQEVVATTEQYRYLSDCLKDGRQFKQDHVGLITYSFERTPHRVIVETKGGIYERTVFLEQQP